MLKHRVEPDQKAKRSDGGLRGTDGAQEWKCWANDQVETEQSDREKGLDVMALPTGVEPVFSD